MATWYVSKTGSNSNPGTIGSPKLTIRGTNSGCSLLSAGDTLNIGDGIYDEWIRTTDIPSGLSAGSPTIIQALNTNLAIIMPSANPGAGFAVINTNDANYITFTGLLVDATNVVDNGCYYIAGNANYHTWLGGTARNANHISSDPSGADAGNGFLISGTGSLGGHMRIYNMDIHDNGSRPYNDGQSHGHGIYYTGPNSIFENNRLYNNAGYGIQLFRSGFNTFVNDNIIRNNIIHNNGIAGMILASGTGNLAYNNIIYNNGFDHGGYGIQIGVVSSSTADDSLIYNNTIYGNIDQAGYAIQVNGSINIIIKNNIFYGNSVDGIINNGSTYTASNNLSSNPLFTNVGSADFTLTPSSSAIQAGVDLSSIFTTDILGLTRMLPFDLGAYAFNGVRTGAPPVDNFNNYTATSDLDTANQGISWSNSWANVGTGAITVETAPAGSSSAGNAARSQSNTGSVLYSRSFSGFNNGIISWAMRTSITNPNDFRGIWLAEGLNGRCYVEFASDGNIKAFDNVNGYTTLAAYSVDTWYVIKIQLDNVNQVNKYRVAVGFNGTYSSWFTVNGGSLTALDTLNIDDSANSGILYIDDIGVIISLNPTESITLTDTPNAIRVARIFVNDTIMPSDSTISLIVAQKPTVSDTVIFTDAVSVKVTLLPISVSDVITVTDAPVITLKFSVSDTATISDAVTIFITSLKINISEPVIVSESINEVLINPISGPTLSLFTSDTAFNTELISIFATPIFIAASDSLTLDDSANAIVSKLIINVSDSITVSDTATAYTLVLKISVVDVITTTDGPVILVTSVVIRITELVFVDELFVEVGSNTESVDYYRRYLNDVLA